jgi:hypothetical protein
VGGRGVVPPSAYIPYIHILVQLQKQTSGSHFKVLNVKLFISIPPPSKLISSGPGKN